MRMAASELVLADLHKVYGSSVAVAHLSLTIKAGELVALLGPSGCGKTTTLRMIAGLVSPTGGEISIDGKPVTQVPVHRRNIGMVFQNYALFPHLTVGENVAFGLEMRNIRRSDMRRRVEEALALVQLSELGTRMPAQLSGGQQQRVALARALVIEPSVLLLDEPLGALDKSLREDMQAELRALQKRLMVTTVMVTHDQDEAMTLADRVAIMRDGRLEQVGSPVEIYQSPRSRFVAGFVGTTNIFEGCVERVEEGHAVIVVENGTRLTVAHPCGVGEKISVCVRPEMIALTSAPDADAPNAVNAVVERTIYRGATVQYGLRLDGGFQLQVSVQGGGDRLSPGDRVGAAWASEHNHVVV